jgi:hypothetical protein
MSRIKVTLINESTVMTDDELVSIAGALQIQVDHDFRPTWGAAAEIKVLPKDDHPPADEFWIGIFDDSDQAGALGYHDLTPRGLPMGKVFAKTDQEYGAKPSVTLSHELLELLGDPYINLTAYDPETHRLYAYESSDSVEADGLGYEINGIMVSDFVLRPFFDPSRRGRAEQLSFRQNVTEPFALAEGGYLSYLDLHDIGAGWQQESHAAAPEQGERRNGQRATGFPPGSRRERRTRLGLLVPSQIETA